MKTFLKGILFFALIHLALMCFFQDRTFVPESGIWFCDELQIQLSYEPGIVSYCVENGKKILCTNSTDRGSSAIYVLWQGEKTATKSVGDMVFFGRCIGFDENKMHIVENGSGKKYTFKRIG